jgi:MFS family permease
MDIYSAQFMGLGFVGPVGIGFLLVAAIVVQIGEALDGVSSITWIIGAWSIAASVAYPIAGSLSDVFGRRYLVALGQVFTIIGGVGSTNPR